MVKKIETLEDRHFVINHIAGLNPERTWMVKVVQFRKKRTVKQNSLYRMWASVIASDIGYTPGEMHDVLRAKYLGHKTIKMFDVSEQVLRSTTDLDTKQFKDFLDAIYRDFSAEGIVLPLPDQQGFEEMYMKYQDVL